MITVYLNFSELASWLMIERLKKLSIETKIIFEWKPMLRSLGNVLGSNLKNDQDDSIHTYKLRRADARHKAARRENERMCEMLGITLHQGARKIDPMYLSLGLVWLTKERATLHQFLSYASTAFIKTFREEAEVESLTGLKNILHECSFKTKGLELFSEKKAIDPKVAWNEALSSGVFTSPAFLVNDEVFLGREHLPLIEWLMTGKQDTVMAKKPG
mgnify:CR=1 FL=1